MSLLNRSPASLRAGLPPMSGSLSYGAKPLWAVCLLSLWLALVGNRALWQYFFALPEQAQAGMGALPFAIGLGLVIAFAIAALLSLLAWPGVFKPVAVLLLVITASNTHFMLQYGTVIDSTMLANVLHTDAREVRDLLSPGLLITWALVMLPPLFLLWRVPIGWRPLGSQLWRNLLTAVLALAAAVGVALLVYQDMASLMRNHKSLRFMINPLNTVYAGGKLLAQQLPHEARVLRRVGEDAQLGPAYAGQARPPLLVLVVGETARAANFGLGGYARQTTPALAQWQAGGDLVYFSDVTSCGTNTEVSVPCMFSPLSRQEQGPWTEGLLDVLQRAGLAVLWIDNQSGCKGACDRVPNVSTADLQLPALCEGGECFDAALLADLDTRLAALDPVRRAKGVVLVMHQMGSHGPAYFRRTPAEHKPFVPECASNTLSECPHEQLVNAFDNTIAYTDYFLGQTLQWLQKRAQDGGNDTGLIYVSDHGESLGENNLYLHGVPYAFAPTEQTHVPMVAWFSPGLQKRMGLGMDCLRKQGAAPISHDHYFHTVLGLMDVKTQVYQRGLDALAPCEGPRTTGP